MTTKIKQIRLSIYNDSWPEIFEEEAALIERKLGKCSEAVHHIGSTSVPGLIAKENIDILCIVHKLSESLSLQDIGYVFKGEVNVPLRYFFSKTSAKSKVNLHVVEKDNGFIHLNLGFRDHLRTNPSVAEKYAKFKLDLIQSRDIGVAEGSKLSNYTLRKNQFIKNVLNGMKFDGLVVNYCMHESEWEAYHTIRDEQLFQPTNTTYDRNHNSLTNPNYYHFVLYKGTSIVSAMTVEILNQDEVACRSLATEKVYQNQGHGGYLMKFLEKWTIEHGRKVIKLHASLAAEDFYRKLGYIDMRFEDLCRCKNYVDLGKIVGLI